MLTSALAFFSGLAKSEAPFARRGLDDQNIKADPRTVLQERAQMSAPERLLLELAAMLGAVSEIGEQ
jgi:hypothetical protein